MKRKIIKIFLSLALIGIFPSSSFASGYIFVRSGTGFDDINFANKKMNFVPDLYNKLPDINSIITIQAKNRLYSDVELIFDINNNFIKKAKAKNCFYGKGGFTNYILNLDKECSVDNFLEKVKNQYDYWNRTNNLYHELKFPIKAKVLGYVRKEVSLFLLVQPIEILEN